MQGFIKKSFPGLGHSFVLAFGGREGAVRTGGGSCVWLWLCVSRVRVGPFNFSALHRDCRRDSSICTEKTNHYIWREGGILLAGRSVKPSGSSGLEKKGESKSRRPGLVCALSGPGGVALTLAASGRRLCKELGRARGWWQKA